MTDVTIYSITTGLVLRQLNAQVPPERLADFVALNLEPGEDWIAGAVDAETHGIQAGIPMLLPPRPGDWAVFDPASWTWTDPRTAADLAQEAAEALQAARAAAMALVHQWIAAAAVPLTAGVPLEEMLSWAPKSAAAEAVLAGTATAGQTLMVATEAALTGETVADLCQIILAKAAAYSAAAGIVAGLRRTVEAQLDAVSDPAACLPIAEAAIAAAVAAMGDE